MSSAEYDNDYIICFAMNTERRMDRYRLGCNYNHSKFIIKPSTLSFVDEYTSIMLMTPLCYQLIEMYNDWIKIKDKADVLLCKQIKNCIDWGYISLRFAEFIKSSFKQLKP